MRVHKQDGCKIKNKNDTQTRNGNEGWNRSGSDTGKKSRASHERIRIPPDTSTVVPECSTAARMAT